MSSPAGPPAPPSLSVFRLLHGALIDLPFRPPPAASVRVATLWPDSTVATGWAHHSWDIGPGGRGHLPSLTDLGDVIGFLAEIRPPPPALPANVWAPGTNRHQSPPAHYLTWYGYLHQITATALVLRGPYPTPVAAYTGAQRAEIAALHHERVGEEPALPGAPPLSPSFTHTGENTTVGDPHHGWIRVPGHLLTTALTCPVGMLQRSLAARVPGLLTGSEPPITIAALAARHLPDQLADPTIRAASPPPLGGPVNAAPPAPDPDLPDDADLLGDTSPTRASTDPNSQHPDQPRGRPERDLDGQPGDLNADRATPAAPTAEDGEPPQPVDDLAGPSNLPSPGLDLP